MNSRLEKLVARLRQTTSEPNPHKAVRTLLQQFIADPDNLVDLAPEDGVDEIMYFEDETISIWNCRFQPHVVIPPHEHNMAVEIINYAGREKNILFQFDNGALVHKETTVAGPGEQLSLNPDVIHAVTAEGDQCSLALHVYFGPLSKIQRGLYDWDTGEKLDFSEQNFERLTRPTRDLPAY